MKIGVCLASMGLPIRRGLQEVSRLAVGGVQADAKGDLDPRHMTDTGRREFRNLLRSYNLELTALHCPLRDGLNNVNQTDVRLDYLRRAMNLAFDLGPRLIIIEVGTLPEEGDASPLTEVLMDLSRFADRYGTIVALESGLDSGAKMARFLDQIESGSLAVNYDPANMLLNGYDPIENLLPLRGKIVHTHAHDARRSAASRTAQEVPVGAGDIEWMSYLATLEGMDYRGWIVVERQSGDQKLTDIANSVAFLRRLMPS